MEINLYPEWSWSTSRDNLFRECKRKYYYHYYASHNGWLSDATEEQTTAYRLKQLTNLYLIFGEGIHQLAEFTLNKWRFEKSLPDQAELKQMIRDHLNLAFKQSHMREQWIRKPKKSIMLHEIYYDGRLPEDRVEKIKERTEVCIENLIRSSTLNELAANEVQIQEVEQLNTFFILDDKIYTKLDLLYKRQDDTWLIVDWKTL